MSARHGRMAAWAAGLAASAGGAAAIAYSATGSGLQDITPVASAAGGGAALWIAAALAADRGRSERARAARDAVRQAATLRVGRDLALHYALRDLLDHPRFLSLSTQVANRMYALRADRNARLDPFSSGELEEIEQFRERAQAFFEGFERGASAAQDPSSETLAALAEAPRGTAELYFERCARLRDRVRASAPAVSVSLRQAPPKPAPPARAPGPRAFWRSMPSEIDPLTSAALRQPRPHEEMFIILLREVAEELEARIAWGLELVCAFLRGAETPATVEQTAILIARAAHQDVVSVDSGRGGARGGATGVRVAWRPTFGFAHVHGEAIELREVGRFWTRRRETVLDCLTVERKRPVYAPWMEIGVSAV